MYNETKLNVWFDLVSIELDVNAAVTRINSGNYSDGDYAELGSMNVFVCNLLSGEENANDFPYNRDEYESDEHFLDCRHEEIEEVIDELTLYLNDKFEVMGKVATFVAIYSEYYPGACSLYISVE